MKIFYYVETYTIEKYIKKEINNKEDIQFIIEDSVAVKEATLKIDSVLISYSNNVKKAYLMIDDKDILTFNNIEEFKTKILNYFNIVNDIKLSNKLLKINNNKEHLNKDFMDD